VRKTRIAILRVRHDPSVDFISEEACLQMMMTNTHRTSVLNYWESVTGGHLDFVGSTMFPWVDIQFAADSSRYAQCALAYDATRALPNADFGGFDAFVVLTLPGRLTFPNPQAGQPGQPPTKVVDLDGGAGAVVLGKPACSLPVMTTNHATMCHEVGHVLGFNHTYGVPNLGSDWAGTGIPAPVYGDPYDIMSGAVGDPSFQGWPVPGWPNQNAFSMGPAPARAHVHLWDPSAFQAGQVRHFPAPFVGNKVHFTLGAAGGRGVQLAVLHPFGEDASGRGRCYVEYRQRGGWDAGLDESGGALARRGVVVHTLSETAEGIRCWYRGRILVPLELDSDVNVAGTALHVRVLSADLESGSVDIEVSARLERGVELQTHGGDEIITVINPQPMSTPCGDTLTYGTWITLTNRSFQPVSYGFGLLDPLEPKPLGARWTVAGIPVEGENGTIEAPTTDGVFTVSYQLNPVTVELLLWGRGGERYRADVTVAVSEADGSGTRFATATFQSKGWYDGYGPGDTAKLARCMSKYAKSVRLRLGDYLVPSGPDPDPVREQLVDRINQRRMQQVIAQVADEHPGPASALAALTAMRYGVR
jgi:hypothetical protein